MVINVKKILITGKNSYVGANFKKLLSKHSKSYIVESISLKDTKWKEVDFSKYDVIIHLAALVHKSNKKSNKEDFFKINSDLAVEVARKAKKSKVKHFIYMSTMAVYGQVGMIGKQSIITKEMSPSPNTIYGMSKLEGERKISELQDNDFKVLIIRPPIIYGPECPGNYEKLRKIAKYSIVFPKIDNQRSMLHINNLCETLKSCVDSQEKGLILPQDPEYTNTSLLVKELSEKQGKRIHLSRFLGIFIFLFGRKINIINKIFGNLIYKKY